MEKLPSFDPETLRQDFPILSRKVHGYPLVYFDNGATTQKPSVVIDSLIKLYREENSSIHRGVHFLSDLATEAYEQARESVRDFIHARHAHEIVFTSGTTGSINAVASSFGEKYIRPGDEILITEMEHHANLVPWQILCERKQAKLTVIPIDNRGELILSETDALLNEKTRILALTHVSNTLGTINPVKELIDKAHSKNIPVLLDGAQAIQHEEINVRELDCDFYVFSGHKIYGPTGIGVLYGKEKWLEEMPPYQYGGDMVDQVSLQKTSFNKLPFKFEAGTTHYTGAIGLGIALKYLKTKNPREIYRYEAELSSYMNRRLTEIPGLKIYGTAKQKIGIFSFLIEGVHPYDAGMILDKLGIAVRTGTHCAQPVMTHFGIDGTLRASLAMYNTPGEVDRFIEGLHTVCNMLK